MNSEAGSRTLSDVTLTTVSKLIPCDLVAFDNFSAEKLIAEQWHNNHEALTPRITEVCSQVFEKHPFDSPLVREQIHNRNPGVLKLSDFGNYSEFANTVFYNEVLRPINVEHQMGVVLAIGPGISIACSVNRRGRDFSERERSLLTFVAPHLANIIRNVIGREQMRENEACLKGLLESSARGVIVLSDDGHVTRMTDFSRRLIGKYFDGEMPDTAILPNELYVLARDKGSARAIFIRPHLTAGGHAGTELRVNKSFNPVTRETNLLLDEKRSFSAFELESLGLTPRQSEVLFWISKGKTDEAIADLIGASRRTVEKHLEHIYQKLGVETRTSAAMAAVERLAAYLSL